MVRGVDSSDVSRWFGEYLDAFAACGRGEKDAATLLGYYGVPLLLTTDGGFFALTSENQVVQAVLQANAWLDKKTRETEDYSDVWNLSQVIDNPMSNTQKQWIYDNVNLPELVNYMAINSIIRHQDSGWYNWWIARDTEGTGRWEMWHWDLNWIFTTPQSDGKGTFLNTLTAHAAGLRSEIAVVAAR